MIGEAKTIPPPPPQYHQLQKKTRFGEYENKTGAKKAGQPEMKRIHPNSRTLGPAIKPCTHSYNVNVWSKRPRKMSQLKMRGKLKA